MPQKEAASSMKRPKATVYKSTDVRNALLGFYLSRRARLRRKLKHRRPLTFKQVIQQHHLPVRKFQRVMMRMWVVLVHLPKDGRRVIDHFRLPRKEHARSAPYDVCEGKFCSPKDTNCRLDIFRRSEPYRTSIEVMRGQFVANLGRTRPYVV
jgi:hypothetical protein